MSRLLALFAPFAVVAFAFVTPSRPREPRGWIGTASDAPELADYGLEMDAPDPFATHFCSLGPDLERLEWQKIDQAIETDNIGMPKLSLRGVGFNSAGELLLAATEKVPERPWPGSEFSRWHQIKLRLLERNGGNQASERAVAIGLAWLAKQQKADGSWAFDASTNDDRIGATGLALLPFLGAGLTHRPGRDSDYNKYIRTVGRGLEFLKRNCPPSGPNAGQMSSDTTAQAIAIIALCEAHRVTTDPVVLPFAQAAMNRLQKIQGPNGSWGAEAGASGDITTTGWAVQALFAGRAVKLVANDAAIAKVKAFLNLAASGPRKSTYGFTDSAGAKPGTAATAIGLLCRYYTDGWEPNHPGFIDGVRGLMKNSPAGTSALRDSLYFHHATRLIYFYGGEEWKTWNEGPKGADGVRKGGMRDWLVNAQVKKDGADHGTWEPEGEWGQRVGRLGTTALNVLTLEVYYRQLPLHRRGGTGAGKILEDK